MYTVIEVEITSSGLPKVRLVQSDVEGETAIRIALNLYGEWAGDFNGPMARLILDHHNALFFGSKSVHICLG